MSEQVLQSMLIGFIIWKEPRIEKTTICRKMIEKGL